MEPRSTVIGKRFLNKETSLKGEMHMTGQGWDLVK